MSKRDYYEVLGVGRDASDAGNQERVSQARAEVPPRPQLPATRRPRRSSRKRPKPTPSSPTPTSARATIASATPAWRRRRQGFDPTVFTGFEDIFGGLGDIFGFGDMFGGGRRRGGPQRGADLRYDLEITFEQSAAGVETTIQIPRHETCGTCSGTGAAAGSSPTPVRQCRGTGQIRYPAGLLHRRAHLRRSAAAAGRVITKPCPTCRGEGQIEQQRKLTVKIPAGIATGQRLRLQRRRRSRARAAARPAISTS